MFKSSALGISLLVVSAGACPAQLQIDSCRTQGAPFYFDENSKVTFDTQMDQNGCRYTYSIADNPAQPHARFTAVIFEKAVIMKEPRNGTLTQPGEFSFFYKPRGGFKGNDTFVVYVCGKTLRGSGCARLTYNATIQ